MVTLSVSTSPLSTAEVDVVAVGAFAPPRPTPDGDGDTPRVTGTGRAVELAADADDVADAMALDLEGELRAMGFDGSVGAIAKVPTRRGVRASMIVVVGLGDRARADTTTLRTAAASVANACERSTRVATGLHAVLDVEAERAAQAVGEGLLLGSYRFTTYRSDPAAFDLEEVVLHARPEAESAVRRGVEVAQVVAGATNLARDLVNLPPQDKRPPAFADRVVAMFEGLDVTATVLDEDALRDGGYGGILGVGQGSSAPPRLVELRYAPRGAERHVALVGKGITFDSGGLSLKPSVSMETMKSDMAGAAAVCATLRAVAELGLPVAVTAVLAVAENLPSGTATRVSDVLTMKDGTTVEVINTDAEGRLVLGDGLVHARELRPDVIIDVATLTGAAVVALGDRMSVVIANDDGFAAQLVAAGRRSGEPLWPLPLAKDEYGQRVEGHIADLRNTGGRPAGAIFGALFLHRFVGDEIAWAHLDIAGPAWAAEPWGVFGKGATGVPTRTLTEWIRRFAEPPTADTIQPHDLPTPPSHAPVNISGHDPDAGVADDAEVQRGADEERRADANRGSEPNPDVMPHDVAPPDEG
ncbi:MAG: leucyl aminopeptidase [Nitriliruptoraceae bacterium]